MLLTRTVNGEGVFSVESSCFLPPLEFVPVKELDPLPNEVSLFCFSDEQGEFQT